MKKAATITLAAFLLCVVPLRAQHALREFWTEKMIYTAAPSLRYIGDARAAALGGAGVAFADDSRALFWNPAALAALPQNAGFAGSFFSIKPAFASETGINFIAQGAGHYRIGKGTVIGLSGGYFREQSFIVECTVTSDTIERLAPISDLPFELREFHAGLSFAQQITPALSLGGGLRYLNSQAYQYSRNHPIPLQGFGTLAGDLGLFYQHALRLLPGERGARIRAGLSLSNIGPAVPGYFVQPQPEMWRLPANLRAGYSLLLPVGKNSQLSWHNDFNKLLVPSASRAARSALGDMLHSFTDAPGGLREELSEISAHFGLEYQHRKHWIARIGYLCESPEKGPGPYLCAGAGYRFKYVTLDISKQWISYRGYMGLLNNSMLSLSVGW